MILPSQRLISPFRLREFAAGAVLALDHEATVHTVQRGLALRQLGLEKFDTGGFHEHLPCVDGKVRDHTVALVD